MSKKVLVVDDEKSIVKGIKFGLMQDDYEVDVAYDGEEALNKLKENTYDIVLLDLMLPKIDGLTLCRQLREFSTVPVIMLTAKGEDMDKILGLEYGADDYMTKPFNILELKARMKAVLRRINTSKEVQIDEKEVLICDELRVEMESRRVYKAGVEVDLTAKEFDLLVLFLSNPNKVYSRESLLNVVWGYDYPGDVRTVDVHVRRLREKVEPQPSEPVYIHTKWGVGYYFDHEEV